MGFDGKVAIVTGASRGIGQAVARALAGDGMRVVINYLSSEASAKKLAEESRRRSEAITVQADVADVRQVERLVQATLAAFARIDVLVNKAGAIIRPRDWRSIEESTWRRTLDVNLLGASNCIRACAPVFERQSAGKVINLTSTYGMIGAAAVVAYTAAKAAVIDMTRAFAKELAPSITVNAVAPGNIDTDMTRASGDEFLQATVQSTPLSRLGTPQDVAYAVTFLASPRADCITGQVLVIDGGHMLR